MNSRTYFLVASGSASAAVMVAAIAAVGFRLGGVGWPQVAALLVACALIFASGIGIGMGRRTSKART